MSCSTWEEADWLQDSKVQAECGVSDTLEDCR